MSPAKNGIYLMSWDNYGEFIEIIIEVKMPLFSIIKVCKGHVTDNLNKTYKADNLRVDASFTELSELARFLYE